MRKSLGTRPKATQYELFYEVDNLRSQDGGRLVESVATCVVLGSNRKLFSVTNKNMGPDPSESFIELRPVCIKVSREPSPQNIKDLEAKLLSVNPAHLTQLVEYVLFPLKLVLQSANITNGVQETAVGCIETLFTRAQVCHLNTFEEMFNYLCMLLSSAERGPGAIADIPEELKLAIVKCLSRLLQGSSLVVKGAFYSPRLLPILGHAVTILLALSEKEKARNLRLSALECLSHLSCCSGNLGCDSCAGNDPAQDEDKEALQNAVKDSVAQIFASFVPGISITLCRIITGDSKQGHAIVMQAIDFWGDFLSLVMNDKHMPVKPTDTKDVISQLVSLATENKSSESLENTGTPNLNSTPEKEGDKVRNLIVDRSIAWFHETGSKLKIVIDRLSMISAHPNWKVRLSVAKFCYKLLVNCKDTLQACVSTMVDLLVGLTRDDYSQVASISTSTLQELSQKLSNGEHLFLLSNGMYLFSCQQCVVSLFQISKIGSGWKKKEKEICTNHHQIFVCQAQTHLSKQCKFSITQFFLPFFPLPLPPLPKNCYNAVS